MKLEELYKAIFSGNVVLFIGAGASKNSGGPVGTELADYVASTLNIDEDTSDLAVFAQMILKKKLVTRKELEECIKKRIEKLEPSQGYLNMSYLPWRSIYSVNYDDLVEKAYRQSKGLYDLKVVNKYNIYDDKEMHQINLFKLNGNISDVYSPEKPLLITYDDLLNQNTFRVDMLKRLTASLNKTMIFVGYSFSDNVLEDILKNLKMSNNYESIKKKYVISPKESIQYISKIEAVYDCEYIDSTAEEFFLKAKEMFEKDYKAKLEAYGKSLSFFSGSNKTTFPPSVKYVLSSYFDYFDEEETYSNDAYYFYRCGNPSWGNIQHNLDVNRDVIFEEFDVEKSVNSTDITEMIFKNLNKNEFLLYKIEGPIAVGKTTFCYRLAYDLYYQGVLSLFVKDTEFMKKNLVTEIYDNLKKPFVIFVDNALNHVSKINTIISECSENNIPVSLFVVMRENDWILSQDRQLGKRLEKVNGVFALKDQLNRQQSIELADKLIDNNVFKLSPEYTKEELVEDFIKNQNIVASLMQAIEGTNFKKKIISDFEKISLKTQRAYAMIALINRLCFPFRWEILQRSLQKEYDMSWEEFIDSVVKTECKGNIIEVGEGERLFYVCRHSLIAKVIVEVFYKKDYSSEIDIYKTIIRSITSGTNEEIFIGRILQNIISHQLELSYSDAQILELINVALDVMDNPYFLLHIKGQFLMEHLGQYEEAVACFDKCIRNNQNREYALHSSAMAHFYMSKDDKVSDSMFQLEVNEAKRFLEKGMNEYPENSYFYQTYFQILLMEIQKEVREDLVKQSKDIYEKYQKNCDLAQDVENNYKKLNQLF